VTTLENLHIDDGMASGLLSHRRHCATHIIIIMGFSGCKHFKVRKSDASILDHLLLIAAWHACDDIAVEWHFLVALVAWPTDCGLRYVHFLCNIK
jgi:hypothetical protein